LCWPRPLSIAPRVYADTQVQVETDFKNYMPQDQIHVRSIIESLPATLQSRYLDGHNTAIIDLDKDVGWMGGVIYVTGMKYTPLTATLGALILSVGSEYAIMMMERFYEELGKTGEPMEVLKIATRRIGSALMASCLTTVREHLWACSLGPFPSANQKGRQSAPHKA